MKKYLMIFLICCTMVLWAKHDGWYCSEVTGEVKTPCWSWCEKSEPLKVLFILSYESARDAVEFAQRMPMDYEVMVTSTYHYFGATDTYSGALSGSSPAEKTAEFRRKASRKYDLVVCANNTLEKFPPDAVFMILQQIAKGTGLIMTGRRLPFRRLYENEVQALELFEGTAAPKDWNEKNVKAFSFRKGRIVQCIWPSFYDRQGLIFPILENDNHWAVNYENQIQAMITAMNWAAGRSNALNSSVKLNHGSLEVYGNRKMNYRIRCGANRQLAAGKVSGRKIPLPELVEGTYYCDLLSEGRFFSSHRFRIDSELGDLTLQTTKEGFSASEMIHGKILIEHPSALPMKLTLELVDSSRGRIWSRYHYVVPAGRKEFSFELSDYVMPALAGYLHAYLIPSKGIVASAEKLVFFPKNALPDYFQYSWGTGTNPNYLRTLRDNLGFTGSIAFHTHPGELKRMAMKDISSVCYFTRIAIEKSKNGGVALPHLYKFDWDLEKKFKELGEDDLNIYRPEVRGVLEKSIAENMKTVNPWGVMLYSLGDENVLQHDAGCGPADKKYFRIFLEKKYGKIETLNREWQSNYKNFSEVPHLSPVEALTRKMHPAWNDHMEYIEKMFTDHHALYAENIRKYDSDAQIGIEGTFGGHDMENMMDYLDWWGPYSDLVENEVLRSLFPDKYRALWAGYHDERGPDEFPLVTDHLVKGTANGNAWYAAFLGCHSIVSLDYRPSFPKRFINDLQRLRFGLAHLLIGNRLEDSGIRIYWSHASRRAVKVNPCLLSPESGITALLQYFYQSGLSGEFVTARTVDRLNDGRILFLQGISVLSDSEAEAIRNFVRKGGIVIADLFPGIYNENMRLRRSSVLSDMFGDIDTSSMKKPVLEALNLKNISGARVLRNPGQPLYQVRNFGQGRAILLNFNLGLLQTSAGLDSYMEFVDSVMGEAGIRPSFRYEGNGAFRVRQGRGFKLLAVRTPNHDVQSHKSFKIILPEEMEVYRCGSGYMGRSAVITQKLENTPFHVYAVFPAARKSRLLEKAPDLTLPKSIAAGEKLMFNLKNHPEGRVILVRVTAPSGRALLDRNMVFDTSQKNVVAYPVEFNAEKGVYSFVVTDVTTGLSCRRKVMVK